MSRARSQPSPMVAPASSSPAGLRDHDLVAGLLDLDERDPRAEVVRHAARVPRTPRPDGPRSGAASRGCAALSWRRTAPANQSRSMPGDEPDPRVRRLRPVPRRVQQDPRLGLAERGAEVAPCPVPRRVGVQRHRASRGEQLDQDAGDRPPVPGEAGADHLLGQRLDDLPERDRADAVQVDRGSGPAGGRRDRRCRLGCTSPPSPRTTSRPAGPGSPRNCRVSEPPS